MGRKKILIEPIKSDRSRAVTFIKRRHGLYKKGHELSVLTGCRTAITIVDQKGRVYIFSSDNYHSIIEAASLQKPHELLSPKNFAKKFGESESNGALNDNDEQHFDKNRRRSADIFSQASSSSSATQPQEPSLNALSRGVHDSSRAPLSNIRQFRLPMHHSRLPQPGIFTQKDALTNKTAPLHDIEATLHRHQRPASECGPFPEHYRSDQNGEYYGGLTFAGQQLKHAQQPQNMQVDSRSKFSNGTLVSAIPMTDNGSENQSPNSSYMHMHSQAFEHGNHTDWRYNRQSSSAGAVSEAQQTGLKADISSSTSTAAGHIRDKDENVDMNADDTNDSATAESQHQGQQQQDQQQQDQQQEQSGDALRQRLPAIKTEGIQPPKDGLKSSDIMGMPSSAGSLGTFNWALDPIGSANGINLQSPTTWMRPETQPF